MLQYILQSVALTVRPNGKLPTHPMTPISCLCMCVRVRVCVCSLHGCAMTCPHLRVLPNLIAASLSYISLCYERTNQ